LQAQSSTVTITKRWGDLKNETFTVTDGFGLKNISSAVGPRPGIIFDTITAMFVNLSLQESLTVQTWYETLTAVDELGSTTQIALTFNVIPAVALTVTFDTATSVSYTGSPVANYPRYKIVGLKNSDTLTVTTFFISSTDGALNSPPTNVETYTVTGDLPVFSVGQLSNYDGINYVPSTVAINKIKQNPLTINYYGAIAGSSFVIQTSGGSGNGAVSETLTAGGTGINCSLTGHTLSNASPATQISTCMIIASRDASRNYFAESFTATVYFMVFSNDQPTGQTGGGPTIGLNGINTVTIDDTSTVLAPMISSLSVTSGATGTSVILNGSGFTGATVKFYRNVPAVITLNTGSAITVSVPGGARSGPIVVTTPNGEAASSTFTVL
jgi:hypothetical protein